MADEIPAQIDASLAVLMLTQVNYRTGRMHPMADITAAAHAGGALVVWDLCHLWPPERTCRESAGLKML